MFSILSEGFVLGLSTGLYCLTSCLPALVPYLLSEGGKGWKTNLDIFLEFLSGRFLAYFLFVAAATLIGKAYKPYLPYWVAPLAMLLTALAMLASLFTGRIGRFGGGCAAFFSPFFKRIPLALGFMTGINICPPFVAAFVRLAELSDLTAGMFYFTGFFTATSILMLPAIAPTPFMNERLKTIGRMTLGIAGIWYLMLGIKGLL
ncbi:MAG: sulfite exporter TauE/SafE family protein [Elusimicrobiales bacterium]|jgi:hypothetical protein